MILRHTGVLVWLSKIKSENSQLQLLRASSPTSAPTYITYCCPASNGAAIVSLLCVQVSSRRRPNESDADWAKRQEAARQEVNSHLLVFIHGSLQALTAIGLLQVGTLHCCAGRC